MIGISLLVIELTVSKPSKLASREFVLVATREVRGQLHWLLPVQLLVQTHLGPHKDNYIQYGLF